MLATTTTKDGDQQPHAMIDPEIVLATRADRANAEADRRASHRQPDLSSAKIDPEFRSAAADLAAAGQRSKFATWAVRTVLAVLFAVGSAVAAAAWQSYGDQAQEMIAHWMPRISLVSNADRDASTQPATSAAQETVESSSPAQEPTAPSVSTAAAGMSPEQAQLLQSMAHDLAALNQQLGELKTSLAQLKAGQDQMSREVARATEARAAERTAEARSFDARAIEQTLRPRPAPRPATAAVLPPPGAGAPVHRPRPVAAPSTGALPPPPAPMALQSAPAPQVTADPDQPVVRPPMPVR
jgi:hypothetical protein